MNIAVLLVDRRVVPVCDRREHAAWRTEHGVGGISQLVSAQSVSLWCDPVSVYTDWRPARATYAIL